jgi:OmpA family
MSFRVAAVGTRRALTLIAIACALSSLGTIASAQNPSPKDEIFGGYAWLAPNGWGDLNYKINNIPNAFDASNTYYFCATCNLGVVIDGSGHFNGATTPGNPLTANDKTGVGYALGGLQYKYHTNSLSPFFRILVGVANISPDCCHAQDTEWNFAAGGGGGLDLRVRPRFSIRLVQADYIYSHYSHIFPSPNPTQWNSVRLATGVVFNLGNCGAPVPLSCTASAAPTEVWVGEPVQLSTTGTNFNPKHTPTYGWTATGSKLSGHDAQTATIDTTGMAAGSYTANATIADPKMKKNGSATCAATFTVKVKPMNPPQVSCSATPATVPAGTPSIITASATSPDNSEITGYSYQASVGTISGTGTTATLDTTGLQSGRVNVTVTATDARNLTGTGTCTLNVEVPPPPPQVSARTPIQFIKRPNQKDIPWRVDNEAKAILDDDASALKNDPNAKLVIVGYADGEKGPMEGNGKKRHAMDLAAQRAVNAKAYLVQQQGIDPGRIEVRKGTGKDHGADIFWVPQGADINTAPLLQGTTPVDESVVTPSQNAYPNPRTAAPARHHRKQAVTSQ